MADLTVPFVQQDSSGQRGAEDDLLLANRALEASFSGIMLTDRQSHIFRINPAFTRILGYSEDEVLGQTPGFLRSGSHDEAFYSDIWREVAEKDYWMGEVLMRCKDGNVLPMKHSITALRGTDGEVMYYIGVFEDVSEKQNTKVLLDFFAYRDALTGLPNRLAARQHFDLAVTSAESHPQELIGVMCLDLDRFKHINDSFGHALGDQVLKILAGNLSELIQEPYLLSRQAGGEFLVVAPRLADQKELSSLADRIIALVAQEMIADGRKLAITASLGVAAYPTDGQALDDLARCAQVALHHAKLSGGNQSCFYSREMDAAACAKMDMQLLLLDAATNGELQMVYQPKIFSANREVVGAEALIRWSNPVLGHVSPVRFIPLAEETGLIDSISEWVLRTVCAQLRSWKTQGLPHVKIAINISGHQFRQPGLMRHMEQVLEEYAVLPAEIDLEITEGILMDNVDSAIQLLQEARQIGFSVSLDDFGTGYSSLSYLKHFPINTLKIDKSFVDGLPVDKSDMAIARTIISLAHSLGMNVVAEGVENREQFEFLLSYGCDLIQGYYFSKPLAVSDFESLLRKGVI